MHEIKQWVLVSPESPLVGMPRIMKYTLPRGSLKPAVDLALGRSQSTLLGPGSPLPGSVLREGPGIS